MLTLCSLLAAPVRAEAVITGAHYDLSSLYSGFEDLLAPPVTAADMCRNGILRLVIGLWGNPLQMTVDEALSPFGRTIPQERGEWRGLVLAGCNTDFLRHIDQCAARIYGGVSPADQLYSRRYRGKEAFAAQLSRCLAEAKAAGVAPLGPPP
ncbi:hypothetical protein [Pseudogemmobacter bohemicus]|uniref:hypothetical protein n=1 Tax=Pseudogemmobacter bohemicus TaxID=2250708 RepID=UPI000DD42F7C|nr:hypothetical protein [Pseudogemmobacter bohemicus]